MITKERLKTIGFYIAEWQDLFDNLSDTQALFALYDDNMITGQELDILMMKKLL